MGMDGTADLTPKGGTTPDIGSQLSTIYNLRDLGGIPTGHGITRHGRFLRSGDTLYLSEADRDLLLDYGVRRVVDLRMDDENPHMTSRLAGVPGVTWLSAPMADDSFYTPEMRERMPVMDYIVTSYRRMVGCREALRDTWTFMAQALPDECVLFHCAFGMDRTGILAALVLGAADAEPAHIAFDFARSFGSEQEARAAVASRLEGAPQPDEDGIKMRVHAFFAVWQGLLREHGSVRGYLRACGVTDDAVDAVVAHLVG